MRKTTIALIFSLIFIYSLSAQQAVVAPVAFYNLENLFDIYDDPNINDEEFTPSGRKKWTEDKYNEKLSNLARVISELATEITPDGAAVIGVCEIENRKVLEDLVKQPAIAHRNYKIVHFDSQDRRGIDVAFLYQEKYFKPEGAQPYPVDMKDDNGNVMFTRDILHVYGKLDGHHMNFLINHWPSRRGGQKASAPRRNDSAKKNKEISDSLLMNNPAGGIVVMGDFNDDPDNESMAKYLGAQSDKSKALKSKDFYNPYHEIFKRGFGTLAYRDTWSLFDQIVVSSNLLDDSKENYYFHKAVVFNKPYLLQKTGQYKGYPFRTFDFDNYVSGYSDHLPVYILLVKKVDSSK